MDDQLQQYPPQDGPAPATRPQKRRRSHVAAGVGLLAAGAIGGAVAAGTASASASPTTSASASSYAAASTAPHGQWRGGSGPGRSDEKSLSAATTATLRAAALKAVPGGTVNRVESDAGDGVYEAHMTKSDGSLVTVKFDKNMKVTKVEAGMGTGDPAPAGGTSGTSPSSGAPSSPAA